MKSHLVDRLIREIIIVGVLATIAALAVFAASGCGGAKVRKVNVMNGEYYSEDEYAALSTGGKNNYCGDLETELQTSQQRYQELETELANTRSAIESARKAIIPLDKEILELESDIRTLKDQIAEVKALPKTYRVRPDDSLSLIASYENIYNDIDKWWKIFEANQNIIDDPYYIFPDTVLVIPRDWPAE